MGVSVNCPEALFKITPSCLHPSFAYDIGAERSRKFAKAIAYFSPVSGRGVVYTIEEKTFLIEVDKMYEPKDAGSANINMWMQGPDDIQKIYAGEYPFTAVYDFMKQEHNLRQRINYQNNKT